MIIKIKATALIILISFGTFAQSAKEKRNEAIGDAAFFAGGVVLSLLKIHQLHEILEQEATQYYLSQPNVDSHFRLKYMGATGQKYSDISNTTVFPFIYESKLGKKLLFMYASKGWVTDRGVDLTRIDFQEFSVDQWNRLMFTYFQCASMEKLDNMNEIPVYRKLPKKEYSKDSLHVKLAKGSTYELMGYHPISKFSIIPFGDSEFASSLAPNNIHLIGYKAFFVMERIKNDEYLTKRYDDKTMVVYNERSLGLFNYRLKRLTQLSRLIMSDIHSTLNDQYEFTIPLTDYDQF